MDRLAKIVRPEILICSALVLIITLLTTLPVSAQEATNYAAVDSVEVGDTFNYSIVVRSGSAYDQIIFPDSSGFGDPLQVVQRKRYKTDDQTDSLAYTLQFFGTENHTIPKLPVHLVQNEDTTTLYVPPVPLDFKSTLQAGNESLMPLKPIFAFALNWWPYLLGIAGLLLVGFLLYTWYRKRKSEKEEESRPVFTPQPFRDPLKELEKNLQQIKAGKQELQRDRRFKDFYIRLGDALRWYLERVYDIPALESTTRELIQDLHQKTAPEAIIHKTETILKEADMVKFARFTPTLDQVSEALQQAEEFIEIARGRDQQRIEYLRSRHEREQQKLKEQMNSTELEIGAHTDV